MSFPPFGIVGKLRKSFPSYAEAAAYMAAQGSASDDEARIENRLTNALISRLAYQDGALRTLGAVRFDRVTATPCGAVASASGTTIVLTAGHSVTALSRVLRVQVVTDGTFTDVAAGQWSVSGNDVTVPQAVADAVAAALGAGKSVRLHVEGVSELCIGGSSCAISPVAGAWTAFVAGGLSTLGRVTYPCAPRYSRTGVRALLASYTALSATDKRLMVGWWISAIAGVAFGIARTATPTVVNGLEASPGATPSTTSGSAVTAATELYMAVSAGLTSSLVWRGGAYPTTTGSVAQATAITEAYYAGALLQTVADDGAVFSSLRA